MAGTRILPKGFNLWPQMSESLPVSRVQELYESGFAGAYKEPDEEAKFLAEAMATNGFATIGEAASLGGWAESGAGQLVAPFVSVLELFPGCWPGPAQDRGDCFPSGTLVRMADGTQKPIETVEVGDMVISHLGRYRQVTDVIWKRYSGDLVSLKSCYSSESVASTPDHRFYSSSNEGLGWRPSGELQIGSPVAHGTRYDRPVFANIVSKDSVEFEGVVYCLTVDEDHGFIANGFSVSNCVSHSTKNAALGSWVGEIVAGKPDEVTGIVEGKPEVSAEGIKNGVLSTESFYWWRRHGGDGWSCQAACLVAKNESGLWLRQNYPSLGVDLTTYSGKTAGLYGARTPPEKFLVQGKKNLIRTFAEAKGFEQCRDSLANFYFLTSCGMEGFEKVRNEHGVSRRTTQWAHAMAYIAADDRPIIKQIYREPLVLVLNSWNRWNKGPRDIYQSASLVPANKKALWIRNGIVNPQTGNIMIPEGAFWARWSEIKSRYVAAFSSVNGFPPNKIKSFLQGLAG